jgi:hypothetical protein
MRADDGRSLRLPAGYLDAGHLAHGHAITGHKAQGLTVDRTFVLATPELYREWGYVALARGRHDNRLYLHATDDEADLDLHQPPDDRDPVATVTAALGRSRAGPPLTDMTPPARSPTSAHAGATPTPGTTTPTSPVGASSPRCSPRMRPSRSPMSTGKPLSRSTGRRGGWPAAPSTIRPATSPAPSAHLPTNPTSETADETPRM